MLSLNALKTIGDEDIKVPPAAQGKSMNQLDIEKVKQSKSSMNNGVREFDAVMYPANRKYPRVKPVSVWDQMMVHDAQLYQKEEQERKLRKRREQ